MQDGAGAVKETVNLDVDADLIACARERGVELADVLERALLRELAMTDQFRQGSAAAQAWRKENAATIAAWNDEVEREGLWNDEFRPF